MSKKLNLTTLLLLFSAVAFMHNSAAASQTGDFKGGKPETIIIDLDVYCGYATWTPMSGTGAYNVKVYNTTTGSMHAQYYTTSTTVQILGLANGNSYRIMVSRGAQVDSAVFTYGTSTSKNYKFGVLKSVKPAID